MYLIHKGLNLDKTKYQFPFTVVTNQTVSDCNWKNAYLAKRKPKIPKGTVLSITNMFQNFEGSWLVTEYGGFYYSINPEYVDVKE